MIFLNILYICGDLLKYSLNFTDFTSTIKNICTNISKINIFYIKIFQWFTYNLTDDKKQNDELYDFFSNFTNNVEYNKNDIDYDVIRDLITYIREEGNEIYVDLKPINSGTIALAFKGRLNNKDIIVKLLRKNILEKINNFYNHMEIIRNILKFLYFINIFNFNLINDLNEDTFYNIIQDCKNDFSLQTDFLNELNNIKKFRDAYKDCKFIEIPNVYTKYTEYNKNILVMDYIKGHSIKENTSEDNNVYMDIINKFILSGYFLKNILHGDLHLGNIIFMKDINTDNTIHYKLGIIDFGLSGTINNILEQNLIYDVLISWPSNDSNLILNGILEYIEKTNSIIIDKDIREKIQKQMYEMSVLNNKPISHGDIILFLKIIKKYKINIPYRLSFLLLSVASQSGSVNKINENTTNLDLKILVKDITDGLFIK
jgi:ubiquinone biosynthesis protein